MLQTRLIIHHHPRIFSCQCGDVLAEQVVGVTITAGTFRTTHGQQIIAFSLRECFMHLILDPALLVPTRGISFTPMKASSLAPPTVTLTGVPRISPKFALGSASTARIGVSCLRSNSLTMSPDSVVLPVPPFPATAMVRDSST